MKPLCKRRILILGRNNLLSGLHYPINQILGQISYSLHILVKQNLTKSYFSIIITMPECHYFGKPQSLTSDVARSLTASSVSCFCLWFLSLCALF